MTLTAVIGGASLDAGPAQAVQPDQTGQPVASNLVKSGSGTTHQDADLYTREAGPKMADGVNNYPVIGKVPATITDDWLYSCKNRVWGNYIHFKVTLPDGSKYTDTEYMRDCSGQILVSSRTPGIAKVKAWYFNPWPFHIYIKKEVSLKFVS
jgi:hypothetical protein